MVANLNKASITNNGSLQSPEVAQKFVQVGGFQVTNVSNLNPSCIELELELS